MAKALHRRGLDVRGHSFVRRPRWKGSPPILHEFLSTETSAVCWLGAGTAGCGGSSRVARTAVSIAARTFRARRVRFTNGDVNASSRGTNTRGSGRPAQQFQQYPGKTDASENLAGGGIRPLPKGSAKNGEQHAWNNQAEHPRWPAPDHNAFQVAQIEPAVLDRVHGALRSEQTVVSSNTTWSRQSGC